MSALAIIGGTIISGFLRKSTGATERTHSEFNYGTVTRMYCNFCFRLICMIMRKSQPISWAIIRQRRESSSPFWCVIYSNLGCRWWTRSLQVFACLWCRFAKEVDARATMRYDCAVASKPYGYVTYRIWLSLSVRNNASSMIFTSVNACVWLIGIYMRWHTGVLLHLVKLYDLYTS